MNANAHDFRLNPHVRDEWVSCQECRDWMMPLANFEVEASDYAWPELDDFLDASFLIWGWLHFVALLIFGLVINIGAAVGSMFKRRKVTRLKKEILPSHPNSQVCPRCLRVKRIA